MKLEFVAIVLSIASLIAACTDMAFNITARPDLARKVARKAVVLLRIRHVPYPGDPDYPWPTTEALALISTSEHVECVCGRPIVLWDYPRQPHANGDTRWWVHVETARRSTHPTGPQGNQGFAMPVRRSHMV